MKKETKDLALNLILSVILTNFGLFVYKENKAISILTILIAITFIYFSFHVIQIKRNEKDIIKLNEKIRYLDENIKMNWKVLNTLTNNRLIENINKILKNQKKNE